MEQKLIPAPIDNKNIMSDALFEYLFDEAAYTVNCRTLCGFINGDPCVMEYYANHVEVHPFSRKALIPVFSHIKRLEMDADENDPNSDIMCKVKISNHTIHLSYYFKPEE